MSNWKKTEPKGNEGISRGAYRIREAKDALQTAMEVEHTWPGGIHKFPYGNGVAGYEGRWRYNNVTQSIERYTSGAWGAITAPQSIPSGTKMLFFQASAPSGWTQDTSFGNDEFLRVISSGSISSGGTWGTTTDTLTDVHAHSVSTPAVSLTHTFTDRGYDGVSPVYACTAIGDHDVSHTHGISDLRPTTHYHNVSSAWRPEYIDVIVGTKN